MAPEVEAMEAEGRLTVDGVVTVAVVAIGAVDVVTALVAVTVGAPPDAMVALVEDRVAGWLVARLLAICWRVAKHSLNCSCKKSPGPSPPDAIFCSCLETKKERKTQKNSTQWMLRQHRQSTFTISLSLDLCM